MKLNYYCDHESVEWKKEHEKGVEKNEAGNKLEFPELDKYSYVLGFSRTVKVVKSENANYISFYV